jgi:hypothetical protein
MPGSASAAGAAPCAWPLPRDAATVGGAFPTAPDAGAGIGGSAPVSCVDSSPPGAASAFLIAAITVPTASVVGAGVDKDESST